MTLLHVLFEFVHPFVLILGAFWIQTHISVVAMNAVVMTVKIGFSSEGLSAASFTSNSLWGFGRECRLTD